MRNSGYKGKRGGDNQGVIPVFDQYQLAQKIIPRISGYQVTNAVYVVIDDDLALNPDGGQYVVVNGSGFLPSTQLFVNNQYLTVAYLSPTQLAFQAPAMTSGIYTLYAINPTYSSAGALVPGLIYSGGPTFLVQNGSTLGTFYETLSWESTQIATSDSPITYSIVEGSIPPGSYFDTFTGKLVGTAPVENNITVYNFVVNAKDAEKQDTRLSLTVTISRDTVTWLNETTIYAAALSPIPTLTYNAVSDSGSTVYYTTTDLPSALSTTGTNNTSVVGTFPMASNDYAATATVVATALPTNRSSTARFTWIVTVGDLFWNFTVGAITGESSAKIIPHNRDASSYNSTGTVGGYITPSFSNPFLPRYSVGFAGSTDWLSLPHPNLSTSWTAEAWVYVQAVGVAQTIFHFNNSGSNLGLNIWINTSNQLVVDDGVTGQTAFSVTTMAGRNSQWVHVAVCRYGVTGAVIGYINGNFAGFVTFTPGTVNQLYLSRFYTGLNYFNGHLHNVRIVNGTALYTGATVSTSFLTSVPGTALLTAQNPSFVDNSGNNLTIGLNGTVQFSALNPFPGLTTYSYWFTAQGQLFINTTAALELATVSVFTIECWVYITASSANQNTIITNRPSSGNLGFDFRINPARTVQFYYTGGSTLTTTAALSLNTWYHLAAVRNGSNFYIFIDGFIAATSTSFSNGTTTGQPIWIGNSIAGSGNYFQGYISNLRVTNTALYLGNFTPPDSNTLLADTTGTTLLTARTWRIINESVNTSTTATISINGSPWINTITPTQTTSSWISTSTGSTYFNGSTNFIRYYGGDGKFAFGTGDFTIEAWIYPTNPTVTQYIWTNQNASTTAKIWIGVFSNAFVLGDGVTTTLSSGIALVKNQWQHVAVTRSSGTAYMFFNGSLVKTGSWGTDNSTVDDCAVGANAANGVVGGAAASTPFTGYISNMRVIKGQALYTNTFTLTVSVLTATTTTSLLTCQYPGPADNNAILDRGQYGFPVVKANNVAQGSFSPYGIRNWSALFNPTNSDTYSISGNNIMNFGSADWTVECWVYLHAMPTADTWPTNFNNTMVIIGVGTASTADGLNCIVGATKLLIQSSEVAYISVSNHGMTTHKWYHLAYVRFGNSINFYVNGVALGAGVSFAGNVGTGANTFIGSETAQGAYFNGYISSLRVVNGLAVYRGAFTPSSTILLATQPAGTNVQAITSQTSLLTLQDGILQDRSYNFSTIATTGRPNMQRFGPFKTFVVSTVTNSTYFNGATPDYLTLPTTFTNTVGGFANAITTMECWICPTGANSANGYSHGIIGSYQAVAANGRYIFGIQGSAAGFFRASFTWTTGTGSQQSVVSSQGFNSRLWTHIAVVIDATVPSSTTINMFVNGVMETFTGLNFSTQTVLYDSNAIGGNMSASVNAYIGYVSGLRWVKGVAVYTGNFTPRYGVNPSQGQIDTTILGITTQTVLLTCQGTQLIDYSNYRWTLTRTNSPKQAVFSPNERSVTIQSLAFDSTSTGGSYWFDQTGDTLTVPAAVLYNGMRLESMNFTIEFWAYPTSPTTTSWNPMLSIGSSGGGKEIRISQNINGTGFGFLVPNGTDQYGGYGALGLGSWHHFAVVRNAGTAILYKNGIFAGSLNMGAFNDPGPIMIAYNPYGTDGNFGGYISDVRIIKGANVYNGPFIPPSAPVGINHGTTGTLVCYLSGTEAPAHDPSLGITFESINQTQLVTNVNKFGQTAMYFNGTNQLLYAPANKAYEFGTGDFTIESWVYPTQYATYGGQIIGCNNYGVAADWFWVVNSIGRLYFQIGSTSAGASTSTNTVSLNAWSHVMVSRSSGVVAQYINGVLAGTTVTYTSTIASTIGIAIGGSTNNNAAAAFRGYVADLRVTKGYAREVLVPGVQLQTR